MNKILSITIGLFLLAPSAFASGRVPEYIYDKYCNGTVPSIMTFGYMGEAASAANAAAAAQKKFCEGNI